MRTKQKNKINMIHLLRYIYNTLRYILFNSFGNFFHRFYSGLEAVPFCENRAGRTTEHLTFDLIR